MIRTKKRQVGKCCWILLCSVFFLIGCSHQMATLRKVTYPPDFTYVDPSTLKTEMGKLAQQMRVLDDSLYERPTDNQAEIENQRQQVLSALANIERIAAKLKSGNAGANHPFMQDYMEKFVSQVGEARVAASLPEPRYYFAGKISGGCTNCHRINR